MPNVFAPRTHRAPSHDPDYIAVSLDDMRAIQFALNTVSNTMLNHASYTDTYKLAARVGFYLAK